MLKNQIKAIPQIFLACFLLLLAVQPVRLQAATDSVEVTIPVSTVFSQGKVPAYADRILTSFTLKADEGSPAPQKDKVEIRGEGKADFGPILFTAPGDYYYQLNAEVTEGEDDVRLAVSDPTILWVSITYDEDGLIAIVKGYPAHDLDMSGTAKRDTVYELQPLRHLDTDSSDSDDSSSDSSSSDSSNSSSSSSSSSSDSSNQQNSTSNRPGNGDSSPNNTKPSTRPTSSANVNKPSAGSRSNVNTGAFSGFQFSLVLCLSAVSVLLLCLIRLLEKEES